MGHISKQIIERLIKNEILSDLDFLYFNTCVDCIKGKLIAKVDRCTELLGVTHTYICGSFTPPAMGGHKYFIMFINDYSHYSFVENEKSYTLWHKRLSHISRQSIKEINQG